MASIQSEPEPAASLPSRPTIVESAETEAGRMQGRQLFAYFGMLLLFLVLARALLSDLHSQFNLSVFPKLATGVDQALDYATEFDTMLNTIYSLMYAFLFSLPIAIVYRVTKDEGQFDPTLGQTIVLLAMVVTAVMVVISGDLARAFGLAGVVGAVRFRNSLDDAKDAVYVFLAIATGMSCGAGAYTVALWTSLIMTGALYFMWYFHFGKLQSGIIGSRHGEKKKRGKESSDSGPPLSAGSAEGQERVDRMIEQQRRLEELATRSREKGDKKSNAALIVETRDLPGAQRYLEAMLAASGVNWHLVNVVARGAASGTLEFVGRLSKGATPGELVQALVTGADGATLVSLELRSLKGQKKAFAPAEASPGRLDQ